MRQQQSAPLFAIRPIPAIIFCTFAALITLLHVADSPPLRAVAVVLVSISIIVQSYYWGAWNSLQEPPADQLHSGFFLLSAAPILGSSVLSAYCAFQQHSLLNAVLVVGLSITTSTLSYLYGRFIDGRLAAYHIIPAPQHNFFSQEDQPAISDGG